MEYKVLLAEDERNLRTIVSTYLSKNGFIVDAVSNGNEAMAAVDRSVYDVIILDIMMPIKDGIEVCKYIRKKYDVALRHFLCVKIRKSLTVNLVYTLF